MNTYATGTEVTYAGDLPCDETTHAGTVIASVPDPSGDAIVTVKFGCGLTQDIPGSELRLA